MRLALPGQPRRVQLALCLLTSGRGRVVGRGRVAAATSSSWDGHVITLPSFSVLASRHVNT